MSPNRKEGEKSVMGMTREEATAYFKDMNECTYGNVEPIQIAIKALEKEPCDDCISREAVEKITWEESSYIDPINALTEVREKVRALPPVTPQQKVGKWIESKGYDVRDHFYSCSECGRHINLICGARLADYPYCHCGAKMEVSENE